MIQKGIILAGGAGTRLYPATYAVSKQLLPIFDKPMIYYPLSTLMLGGIRDILIITTPDDLPIFQKLLGNGSQWGINLNFLEQEKPRGIAEAFILAEDFLENQGACLILGDNIFYGTGFVQILEQAKERKQGALIFAYHVDNPEHYGVVNLDSSNRIIDLQEKPKNPQSSYAITGLYFYDNQVVKMAKQLKPSARGELEITDLNKLYLIENKLSVQLMGRGFAWLDTGTHETMLEASNFIQTVEKRQGLKVSCPEEIAFRKGYINTNQLMALAEPLLKNSYGEYLKNLARGKN